MLETFYVVISSTLIHLFFLVLALFIVYKYYLDKVFIEKYTKQFKKNYYRFIEIVVSNIYKDQDLELIMEETNTTQSELITEIKTELSNKISSINLMDPEHESSKDKNILLIPKYSIIILGLVFIVFVLLFKKIYGKRINLNYSLLEIILSFTITLILVFIYQYYLIHEFLVDVIYLQVPKLLKDNVIIE